MQWNDGYLLAALDLFLELKQYQMLLQGCWNRGREARGGHWPLQLYYGTGNPKFIHLPATLCWTISKIMIVTCLFGELNSCGKVCLISECIIIFTFCPKTKRGNFVYSIFELFFKQTIFEYSGVKVFLNFLFFGNRIEMH